MKRTIHITLGALLLSGTLVLNSGAVEAQGVLSISPLAAEDIALDHLASTLSPTRPTSASSTTSTSRLLAPDAGLRVTSTATTAAADVTHVYVQQTLGGIDVMGADANVAVANGEVAYAPSRLIDVDDLGHFAAIVPALDARRAADAAADALGLVPRPRFDVAEEPTGDDRSQVLTAVGFARGPIPARLLWVTVGKELRLAWELSVDVIESGDWWSIHIDASTGEELGRFNYTITDQFLPHDHVHAGTGAGSVADVHNGASMTRIPGALAQAPALAAPVADGSSYDVFPMPTEAPSFASPVEQRTVVSEPADDVASPFGWHDTDGVAGAESTLTVGNNVTAYTDTDNDNAVDPGSQPDGGAALDFTAPLDLTQDPDAYADAAVINLFYWNNVMHDLLSAHGFDEASGNFQTNNYGRGGVGGDAVEAQALDSSDLPPTLSNRNNAQFATGPDGVPPRMEMYRWTLPDPDRAASFDNGIVAHEYAHGLTARLTGGASNASCLSNDEQAGEGWSDFVGLLATIEPGDAGSDSRGIGTYARGQPTSGLGIRTRPYSTDFAVNDRTYDDTRFLSIPHGVGSVWAAMLWDMTWDLIDIYGYDADHTRGSGGNNLALELVIAGLKLQPCDPGFVDARDAILQADELLNNGQNVCTIWTAFARRGLGASASQGSPYDAADGTEAFDLPTSCPLSVTKSADVDSVLPGGTITYTIDVENRGTTTSTDVVVTDPLDPLATFIAGSETCAAELVGTTLSIQFGTMVAGAAATCSFDVSINEMTPPAVQLFDERFEPDASAWTVDHANLGSATDWELSTSASHSSSHSMFGANIASRSDQYLTLTDPITIPASAVMTFWHRFAFEHSNGRAWDGGVVEISDDGGSTWDDLGPAMTQNGYTDTIPNFGTTDVNPLAGRRAFGGESGGFIETVVELDAYAGETVILRFRLGTDASSGGDGWFVDDVSVGTRPSVPNTATVNDAEGNEDTSTSTVRIDDGSGPTTTTTLAPPGPIDPERAPWDAVTPLRVLDTRTGSDGKRASGSTLAVPLLGRGGVPDDARAAIVNVTAVRAAADGFMTAFACDAPRPEASSLNFTTGVNLGNEIITAVDPDGNMCLFTSAPTHVTVDVVGYVAADSPYRPQTPARLLDTRPAGTTIDRRFEGDGAVSGGSETMLTVAGRGGAPATARTAVINVTAIRAQQPGFVTVHPCLGSLPTASSLNFVPGANRANELVVQLDDRGKVCIFASSEVDLAVDLVGTMPTGTTAVTVGPARLLDSRPSGSTIDGAFRGNGPLPAGTVTRLRVTGRAQVPTGATTAVLNLTAVQATSPGFVTVWPCSEPRPTASSLNHVAGVNGANEIIVGLDTDGADAGHVCLFNDQPVGLIVDVVGATRPS